MKEEEVIEMFKNLSDKDKKYLLSLMSFMKKYKEREIKKELYATYEEYNEIVDISMGLCNEIESLQKELDIANKKIEEIKKYLGSNEFFEGTHFDTNYDDDIVKFNEEVDRVIKKISSIIGGE